MADVPFKNYALILTAFLLLLENSKLLNCGVGWLLLWSLCLPVGCLEVAEEPLRASLRDLLSDLLPQVSSCLVLVTPSSQRDSYLELVASDQLMLRVQAGSPFLKQSILASYSMKCTGYVTNAVTAWEMLTVLGSARSEASGRHLPRLVVLPSQGNAQTGCELLAHPEADYIPDILLLAPSEQGISRQGTDEDDAILLLFTNKFVGPKASRRESCQLLGKWPSDITDFFPDKILNLHGREMVVSTLEYPPYSQLTPVFDGMEARIALEFCKKYNCAVIPITDEYLWGEIFGNGTGIGVSGAVYMDRADMGFGAIYAWEEEHQYVDYSFPYLGTRVTALVPKPTRLPEWRIPFLPFPPTMWALQAVSIVGAAIVMRIVNKLAAISTRGGALGGEFSSLGGTTLRALAMSLLQPPPARLPSSSPLRRFFTIFEVLFLFFTTIYSGALSSVLTVPLYYPPIDSPKEMYESGIPWAADHDAWIYSIKGATEPHLKGLLKRFETHDSNELIRLAKKGGYGFCIEIMAAGHVTQPKHISGEMILGLHVMKNELYTTSIVTLIRKGSPYTDRLNDLISRCLDGGLLLLWETDVTLSYLSSRLQTALKISEGSRIEVHHPTQLQVVHVQGAFIIFFLGLLISGLVFVLEICGLLGNSLRPTTRKFLP